MRVALSAVHVSLNADDMLHYGVCFSPQCTKAKLSFVGVVSARYQRKGEVALRPTRRVQSHDRQGGRLVSWKCVCVWSKTWPIFVWTYGVLFRLFVLTTCQHGARLGIATNVVAALAGICKAQTEGASASMHCFVPKFHILQFFIPFDRKWMHFSTKMI